MSAVRPEPLTREAASVLLAALPTEIGPGLSDTELEVIEGRYGFTFADDHRVFLQTGLPLGRSWPDWRDGDPRGLRDRLDAPAHGVVFDVERDGFWYPGWGGRPEDRTAAVALAREYLRDVPQPSSSAWTAPSAPTSSSRPPWSLSSWTSTRPRCGSWPG